MLQLLRGKVSDRKLRLFAVGCCYTTPTTISEPAPRRAVEMSERYADGFEIRKALKKARRAAWEHADLEMPGVDLAAWHTGEGDAWVAAVTTSEAITGPSFAGDNDLERGAHANLVRDIFGNPFRPVTFDPKWRTSTAVSLAQQMYDSRDFSALPILADALQDAGCDNADILTHCRGSGPHVRGCWVVDLVLGKS